MTLRQTLLLAALLWVAGANAQRGRKSDVIAPTPAADRLAVAEAHAALDAASWTAGLDLRCGLTVMSGRVVDLCEPGRPLGIRCRLCDRRPVAHHRPRHVFHTAV